jgi:methyl-accepting chemotaxis protein
MGNPQEVMAYALVGMLIVNVLILVALGVGVVIVRNRLSVIGLQAQASIKQLQEQTVATLQQAEETLKRVETLTASSELLVREQVTPTVQLTRETIAHVEKTTRGISEGVQTVRRIAGNVKTITQSGATTAAAAKATGLSSGRYGLILTLLGIGLTTLLMAKKRKT